MALQGTLKDFSITEIIQLIGQQLKTGILKIRRGKNVVEIYFVDGMIVHVYSNYRGKKDLIGEILVKAQLITEASKRDAQVFGRNPCGTPIADQRRCFKGDFNTDL
jgi:hypothetical protein